MNDEENSMHIRHATLKDANTICENNIRMAYESERINLSKPIAFEAVKTLLADKEKGFYLVAEQENEIIGQLMITYEWSDWRNSTIWWIQSVYVKPSHRKKGVFLSLFNEIKKQAKEHHITLLRLYVHDQNLSAINVYENIDMKRKSYIIFETTIDGKE